MTRMICYVAPLTLPHKLLPYQFPMSFLLAQVPPPLVYRLHLKEKKRPVWLSIVAGLYFLNMDCSLRIPMFSTFCIYPCTDRHKSQKGLPLEKCLSKQGKPRSDAMFKPRLVFLLTVPRWFPLLQYCFIRASVVSFLAWFVPHLSFIWCFGRAVLREDIFSHTVFKYDKYNPLYIDTRSNDKSPL